MKKYQVLVYVDAKPSIQTRLISASSHPTAIARAIREELQTRYKGRRIKVVSARSELLGKEL